MNRFILLFAAFINVVGGSAQAPILCTKYGITDMRAIAGNVQQLSNGVDTLSFSEESGSKNGALGLDIYVPLNSDKDLLYLDLGLYYGSSTLVGNPGFRYSFVYAANAVRRDTTIQAKYSYGNFKFGLAINLTPKSEVISFLPSIGLDLEYGEVVYLSPDFNIDVSSGQLVVKDLFVKNSLLYGAYLRGLVMVNVANGWGLAFTPGFKYAGRAEDDFENDKTITYPPRGSFEFSIGLVKRFE